MGMTSGTSQGTTSWSAHNGGTPKSLSRWVLADAMDLLTSSHLRQAIWQRRGCVSIRILKLLPDTDVVDCHGAASDCL